LFLIEWKIHPKFVIVLLKLNLIKYFITADLNCKCKVLFLSSSTSSVDLDLPAPLSAFNSSVSHWNRSVEDDAIIGSHIHAESCVQRIPVNLRRFIIRIVFIIKSSFKVLRWRGWSINVVWCDIAWLELLIVIFVFGLNLLVKNSASLIVFWVEHVSCGGFVHEDFQSSVLEEVVLFCVFILDEDVLGFLITIVGLSEVLFVVLSDGLGGNLELHEWCSFEWIFEGL